jgi:dsDNA-binding SOS-regulon protein
VEVYVDDIVVKSRQKDTFLRDLEDIFASLRRYHMMLNPEKCVFGVAAGKLLGFLVSHRGIEANPEKIQAIERMQPPTHIKEVQKLTGSMAALSRFISRLGERTLPFFKLLRKNNPFEWTDEAQEAFENLKRYLSSPPVLVAPKEGEPLLLYIAAGTSVVSMVLAAEREEAPPTRDDPSGMSRASLLPRLGRGRKKATQKRMRREESPRMALRPPSP